MRALSVTVPWPWAILHCGKPIENRQAWSNCRYRGPLAIHASNPAAGVAGCLRRFGSGKAVTRKQWDAWQEYSTTVHRIIDIAAANGALPPGRVSHRELVEQAGHVVGVVDLVGVVHPSGLVDLRSPLSDVCRELTESERRWWFGGFALVLANPRPLARPVPCKGALGLWTMPTAVEAAVREQVAA